jgi:hypothetical protein
MFLLQKLSTKQRYNNKKNYGSETQQQLTATEAVLKGEEQELQDWQKDLASMGLVASPAE